MADKILFLSLYEPSKTGEHIGGPVILANDILKVTDPGLNVEDRKSTRLNSSHR